MMATPRQTPLKTQNDIIKAHLLAGKCISTWQAYKQYNITCLAQRIHELRNAGLLIKSKIVVRDGKRFSNYWLDSEDRSSTTIDQSNTAEKVNDAVTRNTDMEAASNDK
ncbi:helix-turn-helix domain-containing protein [Psychrobacter sp. 230]|uniref:helix-turn-helix domain-containing protein n=1 Tax=Psychrobacter sp. 230 TaxID=2555884 RepID=UPI0010683EC9|nr:helix-turn-helix domain-containing protein [Psychrobacter sp. 230]TEW87502.1 hypothetical protein E2545_04525 [Psychrobacter sp. 230]